MDPQKLRSEKECYFPNNIQFGEEKDEQPRKWFTYIRPTNVLMLEEETVPWSPSSDVYTWVDHMEIVGQENEEKKTSPYFRLQWHFF